VYHLTWHHIPDYLILQNFSVVVVVVIIIIYQLLLNKYFYVLSDYECGRYLYFVILIVVEWDVTDPLVWLCHCADSP